MLCYLLAWLGTTRWPWLQAVDDACGLLLVQLLLLLLLLLPLVEGTIQSPAIGKQCVSTASSVVIPRCRRRRDRISCYLWDVAIHQGFHSCSLPGTKMQC